MAKFCKLRGGSLEQEINIFSGISFFTSISRLSIDLISVSLSK
jgi:hypothetical protein